MLTPYKKSPDYWAWHRDGPPEHHYEDLLSERYHTWRSWYGTKSAWEVSLQRCQERQQKVTKMSATEWRRLNQLRRREAQLKDSLQGYDDLSRIAKSKVDEDDGVRTLEKERLEMEKKARQEEKAAQLKKEYAEKWEDYNKDVVQKNGFW